MWMAVRPAQDPEYQPHIHSFCQLVVAATTGGPNLSEFFFGHPCCARKQRYLLVQVPGHVHMREQLSQSFVLIAQLVQTNFDCSRPRKISGSTMPWAIDLGTMFRRKGQAALRTQIANQMQSSRVS